MAVVHRDRMTFLGDNNTEFLEIISSENIPKQGNVEEKFRKLPNKHFIDLIEEASKFADRRVFLMVSFDQGSSAILQNVILRHVGPIFFIKN